MDRGLSDLYEQENYSMQFKFTKWDGDMKHLPPHGSRIIVYQKTPAAGERFHSGTLVHRYMSRGDKLIQIAELSVGPYYDILLYPGILFCTEW